eukprot:14614270-Alexandrium_andersonii.AAC.1
MASPLGPTAAGGGSPRPPLASPGRSSPRRAAPTGSTASAPGAAPAAACTAWRVSITSPREPAIAWGGSPRPPL